MSEQRLSVEKKVRLDNVINESSPETSSTDLINTLPSECLARIFMCLDVFDRIEIRKICRNWKDTCDNFAWYDIKKFVCHPTIGRSYDNRKMNKSDVINALFYCGRYLRHLKLSEIVDSSIMALLGNTCKNLTHLEIKFDNFDEPIDENHYTEAFIKLTNLRSIKIEYYRENSLHQDFPTQVLNSLSEGVDEITLSNFPVSPFDSTLEKFNGLRILDLTNYTLNKNTMREIAKKTTIVKLSLRSCLIENEDAALISNPINLETLHLEDSRISKECVIRTVKNCKTIKSLQVDCDLSSFAVGQITQLDTLKCLKVHHVDDLSVIRIVSSLKNLMELHMNCENISNVVLQDIGQLKKLECLVLSDGFNVDDDVIISISNNCSKLKRFELSNCKDATASALCELAKLKNLEVLALDNVENFDNDAITCIVSECKNITSLELCTCYKLTEIGLRNIAKLENLKNLNFHDINNTSDAIFNGIHKLKSLSSTIAVNFTVEGMIMLLKNCPNLEELSIYQPPFNDEVLSCAVEETCRRTNNTLLTINMMSRFYGDLKNIASLSPLLKVTDF
ncbi:hypothetical protein HCN44_006021 [Aphidius gifuensis]|uniref:F-box domain-containing protein n=1 Tax=Aphidius gifuensis TaxID=684658 RepID=A0A834Y3M6_APHGI|nr:uncharacterized protein LOC122851167 [Aphidius gifuensis]KAF7997450.1 hypothetical protein HCN44_006021 [Aphidius gifuensis]